MTTLLPRDKPVLVFSIRFKALINFVISFLQMLVNGPAIPVDGDDVRVLSTPAEFYERLIQNISQARDRLVITSLYIGNGELEEKLYNEIERFLERGGSATIIVDHGRGLRGDKKSTYARCLKMYKQFHHNLTLGVK